MYFNWQLWRMTIGLRARIAFGVVLGLVSLFVGIARFAFLGHLLARVFAGAHGSAIASQSANPPARWNRSTARNCTSFIIAFPS